MREHNDSVVSDQAEGLRQMLNACPGRVIAISSGKGGVGKTNVAINLAMAFAQIGKETLLLDADLGLANIDIMLGLNCPRNLSHVLHGECALEDVIVEAATGLKVIPAASGINAMASLTVTEQAGLIRSFSELNRRMDVMIVDTAAGISENVQIFARACQETIVVVCDEPASITDAYALIKVLSRENGVSRFRVLANMVVNAEAGRRLFAKLARVTDRFLNVSLDYVGAIPQDSYLRKAVQLQRAVVDAYPGSKAALAFRKLVQTVDKWPDGYVANGNLQFFLERMVYPDRLKGLEVPA
jgi:flagellar biosynthesis protein FlhG